MNLMNIFKIRPNDAKTREQITQYLKINPDKLAEFEKAYKEIGLEICTNHIFDYSAKSAIDKNHKDQYGYDNEKIKNICKQIAFNLKQITPVIHIKSNGEIIQELTDNHELFEITKNDLNEIPEDLRPQLTEKYMTVDISNTASYKQLINLYIKFQSTKNVNKKKHLYGMIRQGLDILDIDPIIYEMLNHNPNSMGYWLPRIAPAIQTQSFFKIPETRIAKVPMSLYQMTRLDYACLNKSTLNIIDMWAYDVFNLDETKSYFIKTGLFSSKFDFRNAKITSAKEVKELGEYLVFIQNQATTMASYLVSQPTYGVATTNEFVVREFIEDTENNPCIYKGMPLRNEYRVFIDFDINEIIGVSQYWRKDVMTKVFAENSSKNPHYYHDYVIYKTHEDVLKTKFELHLNEVIENLKPIISSMNLSGQWSLDIMQSGNDFYLIDMALASQSALNDVIPKDILKNTNDPWLDNMSNMIQNVLE